VDGWTQRPATLGRITVVSASVGAGHDGAADELSHRLREAGYQVDCHDFLDLLGPRAGRALRQAYAMELKVAPRSWGWLLASLEQRDRLATATGGLFARVAMTRAARILGPSPVPPPVPSPVPALSPSLPSLPPSSPGSGTLPPPRVVVSTYPLASQVLGRMRAAGDLAAPVVTYLTDLSVPTLWLADGVDLHLALHEVAAAQARRRCTGPVEVCAPVVRPAFHPVVDPAEAARTRARYGLPPTGRLALVVAGSWGVGEVAEAAADLAATGLVTPVTVCGRNQGLRERLAREGTGVALGWVDEMPALIRASDIVVQNAGGLTSLEAMAAGVPVVTYRCLPGHGTTNAAALHDAGLARWIRDPAQLAGVLAGVLDGELGRSQRAAADELFRAPSPIDSIIALAQGPRPVPLPRDRRPAPAARGGLPVPAASGGLPAPAACGGLPVPAARGGLPVPAGRDRRPIGTVPGGRSSVAAGR
jgi:UDP-N-acetylglucosamine:LPS N-acetylglucosamine transferase